MRKTDEKHVWLGLLTGVLVCCSCGESTGASIDDPPPSWLEGHAVPFLTVDPYASDPNLSVLQATVGDARIVGMGEATHGTREFWKIRQKLSKYLVEEMGFTAILHEAPFPNALYIDAYVTRGEGTALEAHERLGYWRYQEMQELIAWMRQYNLYRGNEDPELHYFGYDCAFRSWTESINLITAYLEVVDPSAVDEITAKLNTYTPADAQFVVDFLAANSETYTTLTGAGPYDLVLRIAENLEPSWHVWYALENGLPDLDIRESFNIGNVEWIIENLLDGGKVIVWAHNGHVGNVSLQDGGTQASMLGARLKERFGDDYYIIGTEFYGGRFQAWDVCGDDLGGFIVHEAAHPGENTYAYQLHQADIPLFFLDLSKVDYSVTAAHWLLGPMNIRFIGASYCADFDEEFYYSTSLPNHYDAIVYFEDTSPTTRITF